MNEILQGDCLEVMMGMADDIVDLTVTSPPYDNLRDYEGYAFNFEGIADELYRVTKQGGVVVWVVGDATIDGSETGTSFKQALYFKEIGFNLHDTMIYEKNGPAYPASEKSTRYSQVFEYMFVLSKGVPKTINLIKDRKNKWAGFAYFGNNSERKKTGEIKKRKQRKGDAIQDLSYRFNIWKINNGKGYSSKDESAFRHPAIFPEKLAQDHILSWSNKGDVVFDPMCGSGTTPKMAKKNGRNFLGIDVSETYCEIARNRLAETQMPLL